MTIQAIPTSYNGCIFRSRTEARWAAFWDLIGLRWEYEPEGFKLEDGMWYLPDFWLPDMGAYAEVKPTRGATSDEWDKAVMLAEGSAKVVLMLDGAPWPKVYEMAWVLDYINGQATVARWAFCWHDKYLGPKPHDSEPRVYFQPAEYEAEGQTIVGDLMAVARKVRLDEPTSALPLGWESIEVVE